MESDIMKERILLVGFGQCGGNIVEQFQDLDYNTMVINTSNADLEANRCKIKYHIPASFGCNRNMAKALDYAKEYYDKMYNFIESYFPRQDIIYFVGGLGGGTGAGLIPIMLDICSSKSIANGSNKKYGAIVVLPKKNEPIQSLRNAMISYKQLTNVKNGKAIFVLDNNTVDNKFKLNRMFAEKFDAIVNMTNPNARGVIDESEIEDVLTCKGNAIIQEFDIMANNMVRFKSSIFTDHISNAKKMAITSMSQTELNIKEFRCELGNIEEPYIGYNDKSNILIASGMQYPYERILEYQEIIENSDENDEVVGLDYDINIKSKRKNIDTNENIKHDTDGSVNVIKNSFGKQLQYDKGFFEKSIFDKYKVH
jgi:cell division GTPase FtsZ